MFKTVFCTFVFVATAQAFAEAKIKVVILDLHDVDKGGLEACGTAIHQDGKKPLLVTLTHDKSKFTTLTSEDGQWCVVFKRWTFKGEVSVSAATMDFKEKSETDQLKELL